jgi:hypothetical protein
MWKMSNSYEMLFRKRGGRRQLERPRHSWEENIKIDLKETGYDGVDWIHLSQDTVRWRALVNTIANLRIP